MPRLSAALSSPYPAWVIQLGFEEVGKDVLVTKGQRRPLRAPAAPTAARVGPREVPGPEVRGPARLKRRLVVEVAAFGLPLVAGAALAVAALTRALDLGRGPLERGADLVGLQLGDRPLVAVGGLPAALPQPPGDHDPVPLGKRVGQVLGLATPDVDLEERGVAVAPLAVLLDALGDGDPQVGDGGAGVDEADFGVLDQVADDGGVVVRCHLHLLLGVRGSAFGAGSLRPPAGAGGLGAGGVEGVGHAVV